MDKCCEINQKISETKSCQILKMGFKTVKVLKGKGIERISGIIFTTGGNFGEHESSPVIQMEYEPEEIKGEELTCTITVVEDKETGIPDMRNPPDMLELEDVERSSQIHHANGESKASFDLTDFDSAETFCNVLSDVGLNPFWNYYRISFGEPESDPYYAYVWANDDGMVMTSNNPLTGDYSEPESRENQPGYASYIGIEGTQDFVDNALVSIVGYAEYYTDMDKERRSFM